MAKVSAQELAELVPYPLEQVRRLEALGILESDDQDGLFPSSDAHVVRLMAAFEEAGISLEDVAPGRDGRRSLVSPGLFLPEPVEMSASSRGSSAGTRSTPSSSTWSL